LVLVMAPVLAAQPGGPVTAAQLLISWSHPGRCLTRAAARGLYRLLERHGANIAAQSPQEVTAAAPADRVGT
jgi:hypothetical protein